MLENPKLSILMGGLTHCTPQKWNKDRSIESTFFARVFAFWLPITGGAILETTSGKYQIGPGSIYFISGQHMLRQTCEKEMSVYWVAFTSESFYLHHRLSAIKEVHCYPLNSVAWVKPVFERFTEFFDPDSDVGLPMDIHPPELDFEIHAVLMWLTGRMIKATEGDLQVDEGDGLERLRPAIDFMDEQYLRNPSVSEVAGRVRLGTDYFRQYFKRETGITPSKYMENRRLDLARRLLFDRRLNISEISAQTGYNNPFYFSRAFRRRFGVAPSRMREASWSELMPNPQGRSSRATTS